MLADPLPLLHLTPRVDSGHVMLNGTCDSEVCLFCQKVESSGFSPFFPVFTGFPVFLPFSPQFPLLRPVCLPQAHRGGPDTHPAALC